MALPNRRRAATHAGKHCKGIAKMNDSTEALEWIRVADADELPPGRVKTVTAGTHSMALTNIDGEYTAMDNRCPHQGGPLGEGTIEVGNDGQCWLRCPWHGWDFDPKTGKSPGGHEDTGQSLFPLDVRDDGIYVGLEAEPPHETTVTDIMAQTMTNWCEECLRYRGPLQPRPV